MVHNHQESYTTIYIGTVLKSLLISCILFCGLGVGSAKLYRIYEKAITPPRILADVTRKDDETPLLQTHMVLLENIKENIPSDKSSWAHEKAIRDTAEEIPLCAKGVTTKSYMDADAVTNEDSAQYKLLSAMHVDARGHYETDDGYLAVALGSYYGPVGTKYIIELDSGVTFKAIKADEKADKDVFDGCTHRFDGSMLEFILDSDKAAEYYGVVNGYVCQGNLNNSKEFKGAITSIKRVTLD